MYGDLKSQSGSEFLSFKKYIYDTSFLFSLGESFQDCISLFRFTMLSKSKQKTLTLTAYFIFLF